MTTTSHTENTPVNHPVHYNTHPSGVEAIEVCEWMGFNRGSAMKYIWRRLEKAAAKQDTEKALWYTTRELERWRTVGFEPIRYPVSVVESFMRWYQAEPDLSVASIGYWLFHATETSDLERAQGRLIRLLEDEYGQ